ncbi:MAG TPA: ABC transporter substrate-binding protein [Ilumatobacteraceae bacterium]|nr:ABC transporter substrate-binding protein [Ilumatobacteraceae bacterium]
MTVTVDINPDAVWEDGTPITWEDFECSWQAQLNTPGSIETSGYDAITSVTAGDNDQQVIFSYDRVYAPYKTLFDAIIKKAAVADCMDISADFQTELPISGRPYMINSFGENELELVPNPNWWGDAPKAERVLIVGFADQETELAAINSGEVDFIYPQFFQGIEDAVTDPNVVPAITFGGDYEGLYFQMGEDEAYRGPLADDDYRNALVKSIDREALFAQIYAPLVDGAELLQCGPIVPGLYCTDAWADNVYDPEGAEQIMTDAGWTKNGDGFWADADGNVPEVRWMVNTGNTRRESAQAYLIPLLAAAGFNVIADNCEALPCVFQQRLPALDYDIGLYISTAPPDPAYLVPAFTCAQIPTAANGNQGQNQQGVCNEEASAMLEESDITVDEQERADLITGALDLLSEENFMLPLLQFPKSGFYRSDRVGGPVEDQLNNYRAFHNLSEWEDVDGDGQIIVGAEQYPGCLNPLNECANSSWYVWAAENQTLPGIWRTTNDALYELTNLAAGEPVVEVL